MIIPLGRINADRPLGRVADFCSFCRGIRPYRIYRVESVRYFYFMTFGGAVNVGQSKVCESCQLRSPVGGDGYQALSTDPDADLETLIAETNPQIRRHFASRLLLEERIRARKLSAGERAGLLREPFEQAAEVLGRRDQEGRLDRPSAFGGLATVLLPIACLWLLPLLGTLSKRTIELVVVVVGGACLAFTLLAILTDARRHASRAVIPRLVESLRPLDPSVEEIELILGSFRQARSPLAEVVSPRDLANRLMERWD